MLEAAIGMPLYMMCIFFIPAVIPFMFNMLGAHYASVISLREVSTGPRAGAGSSLEQQLYNSLENNFRAFTTGVDLNNVTVQTIRFDDGVRSVSEDNISCLRNGSCRIPRGGFVSISTQVRFINMSSIGLPDFSSRAIAIMKMNNF